MAIGQNISQRNEMSIEQKLSSSKLSTVRANNGQGGKYVQHSTETHSNLSHNLNFEGLNVSGFNKKSTKCTVKNKFPRSQKIKDEFIDSKFFSKSYF